MTGQYAGLFFRAEGAGSAPFDQTQDQSYNQITAFRGAVLLEPKFEGGHVEKTYYLVEGAWSGVGNNDGIKPANTMDWLQFQ